MLKWHKLNVKEHIAIIMNMGNMIYMDDKTYAKIGNNDISVSKEELEALYHKE